MVIFYSFILCNKSKLLIIKNDTKDSYSSYSM